jgi:hypothetical protein
MKNKNKIKASSLLLGILLLFSISNPSLSEYESHELQRFKGGYCINSNYAGLGSIDSKIYKSICEETVSNYLEKPENLFAVIRANTEKYNFIFFSTYETHYYEISNQISKRVEQHSTFQLPYRDNNQVGNQVAALPSDTHFHVRLAVGVFGGFSDFRDVF